MTEVRLPDGLVVAIDLDAGPQPHAGHTEFAILGPIVRSLRPRIAVEVGVMYGQTTVYLANLLPPDGVIYALDINPDLARPMLDAWSSRDFVARIRLVRGSSQDTIPSLPDGIGFAFVDGDHAYASVQADTDLLWPKMAEGGVIAFHDCAERLEWPDVRDFVKSRFPHAIRFEDGEGLALVQKRS